MNLLVSEFARWKKHANDSRSYPRKSKPFRVAWVGEGGRNEPGIGIELSPSGIVFGTQMHPKTKEVTIRAVIREKTITMRVAIQRETASDRGGKPWYQFACKLTGIAADDWDLLSREVSAEAEPENRAASELNEARQKDDDAYRTLSLEVQRKIISFLVDTKRLDQPAEGALPPLRMHVLGRAQAANGRMLRRMNIHSRRYVPDMDTMMAYDTQFTIDDEGNVEFLS